MSTNPSMSEPRPTTEITARGRSDPWAAADPQPSLPATDIAPRQFEPTARSRLRNLMDKENAYCE
ncbi:uncharacterized protein NP_0866A [Natronomonas pharaonis DSM 2160]|uniref:Uncharacterized protein n=1 Tax=Natronomonas pharaonis (strain ATCC 35678 / DSM 2160 / CIP 103997 / JCM 8858 / NBRC 14720 / NCIMB 2260 / Gabara) TaxID=348780 RepID=A0A1U7EU87_NATPD|nr:hypothetical protein [Natronomonas pharaonis]CAI48524.1 uncharacterized protein NP_0866A [Natronomonas pharaonis DSM 2160]